MNDFVLRQKTDFKLLLKEGERGASLLAKSAAGDVDRVHVDALSFAEVPDYSVVDTTGAGDTFTAAFAVRLCEQKAQGSIDFAACMAFASRAAFLCISRFGAVPALPHRAEVDELLSRTAN